MRSLVTYWEPTDEWKRERNPITKKEILLWYERSKRQLEARQKRTIRVKIIAHEVTHDRDTGEERRAKHPTETIVEKWQLSGKDFYIYRRMLEERFTLLKKQFDERLQDKKKGK